VTRGDCVSSVSARRSTLARRGRRAAGSLVIAILALVLWSSAANASPTITSVTFFSPASDPDGIEVSGTGFGNQPPSPTNLAAPGYTGHDYGNALYLCDTTSNPNAFCAGWRGAGDTIGLNIYAYRDNRVGISLGSSYSQNYYPNDIYRLQQGDQFTLNIEGATCSGTVSYSYNQRVVVPCSTAPPPPPPCQFTKASGGRATRLPGPLHTEGRYILRSNGRRYKLESVSWYGAEEGGVPGGPGGWVPAGLDCQPLRTIAREIRSLGFNSVRLPWSNYMLEQSSRLIVPDARVRANLPQLQGKHPLQVFIAVVKALRDEGLAVILDNHSTDPIWCCSRGDSNGLWFSGTYTREKERRWISDWVRMASLFKHEPAVIAADLRNEPRCDRVDGYVPTWAGQLADREQCTDTQHFQRFDWRAAATRAGNAVRKANPRLLVIVEGTNFADDLRGVSQHPIRLNGDRVVRRGRHRVFIGHLVYSAHNYSFAGPPEEFFDPSKCISKGKACECAKFTQLKPSAYAYNCLHKYLGEQWGFIIAQGKPYTAPVWVGEFGTCNTDPECVTSNAPSSDPNHNKPADNGYWFKAFTRYLREGSIDWSYWPLNGTMAFGQTYNDDGTANPPKFPSDTEGYGILNKDWSAPASKPLMTALRALERTP
jgi:endoglucanase